MQFAICFILIAIYFLIRSIGNDIIEILEEIRDKIEEKGG